MKKLMKNNYKFIFGLIFGVIISCVTMYTVHAVSSFSSTDIEHKLLNNSTTTVKQALDDLYTLHSLGTADASHLLAGKTAISGGSFISGLMTDYSNSTAIACTKANTSNKLYIKPNNNGYYTTASSFDTGISYNPSKTYGSYTATGETESTTSGTTTSNDIKLGKNSKITIPAGYYANDIVVKNDVKGSSGTATLLGTSTGGVTISNATQYSLILVIVSGMYNGANGGGVASTGMNCTDSKVGKKTSSGSSYVGIFSPSQDSIRITPIVNGNGAEGNAVWCSGFRVYGIK